MSNKPTHNACIVTTPKEDGAKSDSKRWIADNETAVLFNARTGRLCVLIEHDGYGKYYPTFYLSAVAALRFWLQDPIGVVRVSWRPFQRVALECVRMKCDSMKQAIFSIRIVQSL